MANIGQGQRLYEKAKNLIPGGTQLLSKRPEMFLPDQWPAYYSRARGAEIWDLDGVRYLDMSYSGLGSCILGYGDPDVDVAVYAAVNSGSMSTLNCPEEVELAELLVDLHPWAEKVRYTRTGGEAMAVAVRIARAATGRDKIAFCGYHGWHDWYLAANLGKGNVLDGHLLSGLDSTGVPRGLGGTMFPFRYNHIEELEAVMVEHGSEIAAVVMEPVRDNEPEPGFLKRVRELSTLMGSVLVFDEVTAGWRLTTGGAHLVYGVDPDIAVFAKGISNGYPMGAIIGIAGVMEAAQRTFISSTYWTEKIGPAAALATIRKHRDLNVACHLIRIGCSVQDGWRTVAKAAGLQLTVSGIAPLGHFSFGYSNSQAVKTLFTQLMLARGFLATNAFYAMFVHGAEAVEKYLVAVYKVFGTLVKAVGNGSVEKMLKGPVAHKGFERLA